MNWSLLALISLTVAISRIAIGLGAFTPAPAAVQTQEAQSNGNAPLNPIKAYMDWRYGP
jgi:hypothetical protein